MEAADFSETSEAIYQNWPSHIE